MKTNNEILAVCSFGRRRRGEIVWDTFARLIEIFCCKNPMSGPFLYRKFELCLSDWGMRVSTFQYFTPLCDALYSLFKLYQLKNILL